MGEYANYLGTRIKIGTCEDMLYLRADQAALVNGDTVRAGFDYWREVRFRFPWPDEDHVAPGGFDDPFRSMRIDGVATVPDFEHDTIQFIAGQGQGYNVCLPCPEGPDAAENPYTVHRNGFGGSVFLIQQRIWLNQLVAVCACVCGAKYRLPTWEDAEPYVLAVRAMADHQSGSTAKHFHDIADRITAGYVTPPAWVASGTSPLGSSTGEKTS